ncbi:Preprotein translocase subunit SecG [Dissulfuribacter thermophilus]|uniref:Protein-export membrane protein SecG n=1 Tax=Dissulfuribacter thermophilus TaxID=1156395 RepID=A0A1B9F487_9BACT|nr:preprotein translocase subunit SecG [Dissulfuribacter thermophilus]OCC14561.1 Preprotein translocase subunit SecG [Dissulfuribacter thermophilus]
MFTVLVIIHTIVCILLVGTVLLQQGKGAEVGAVFGSSEAIFGSTGPTTFLSKMTSVLAVLFMLTSLGLTYLASHRGAASVMQDVSTVAPVKAPEAPAALPEGHPVVPADEGGQKAEKTDSGSSQGTDANK